jgi:hypothetical protein
MFGALAVMLALVYADVRYTDPRTIRRGPAVLLDTSFLLFELVLILAFGGYPFRPWIDGPKRRRRQLGTPAE